LKATDVGSWPKVTFQTVIDDVAHDKFGGGINVQTAFAPWVAVGERLLCSGQWQIPGVLTLTGT
jgi:hypothetical protein